MFVREVVVFSLSEPYEHSESTLSCRALFWLSLSEMRPPGHTSNPPLIVMTSSQGGIYDDNGSPDKNNARAFQSPKIENLKTCSEVQYLEPSEVINFKHGENCIYRQV